MIRSTDDPIEVPFFTAAAGIVEIASSVDPRMVGDRDQAPESGRVPKGSQRPVQRSGKK